MKVFRIFDRRPRRHASPILSIGCAAVIAIALLGPGPTAFAGEFAVYTTTGGTAVPGGSFTTSVILENLLDVSQGWSYSVCHDPTVLALTDADIGADGMMVNGGAPPDFVELQQYDSGWTVGVVINLIGAHVLGLGTFEIGRGY